MSNSTRWRADNSGNHADLWPKKFTTAWSNGSTLLKIPYKHKWSDQKGRLTEQRTANTNVTNHTSHVSLSTPFYTDISFLANGFNILLHKILPHGCHMSPLDSPCKLYKHRYNCFLLWAGLFSLFQSSKDLQIISFSHAKNKKYENSLAPTDFAIK